MFHSHWKQNIDHLSEDFPRLMKMIPAEDTDKTRSGAGMIRGGIFSKVRFTMWSLIYLPQSVD